MSACVMHPEDECSTELLCLWCRHRVWLPCEHPERPLDFDVVFHSVRRDRLEPGDCVACVVAVEAAVKRSGSVVDDIVWGRRVTLAEAHQTYAAFLDRRTLGDR